MAEIRERSSWEHEAYCTSGGHFVAFSAEDAEPQYLVEDTALGTREAVSSFRFECPCGVTIVLSGTVPPAAVSVYVTERFPRSEANTIRVRRSEHT